MNTDAMNERTFQPILDIFDQMNIPLVSFTSFASDRLIAPDPVDLLT